MQMDRIEELRELYDSIIDKIEPNSIANIVLNDIKKVEHNIDAHLSEVTECYENYLELINTPESKHIALNRLKSDFEMYGDEAKRLFSSQQHLGCERVQTLILKQPVDIDVESWLKICQSVETFFFALSFENVNEDLSRLEFELIGATPKTKTRTRADQESKLALNQNELMYLFMKLGAKDLFTKQDKTHLARGVELLSGFSANKTREKGANLKLSEFQNIKTILDSISVSLDLDIKQSSE
jgi:hypothetical protein